MNYMYVILGTASLNRQVSGIQHSVGGLVEKGGAFSFLSPSDHSLLAKL